MTLRIRLDKNGFVTLMFSAVSMPCTVIQVAERLHDALCLSVVSQQNNNSCGFFYYRYLGFRFTTA